MLSQGRHGEPPGNGLSAEDYARLANTPRPRLGQPLNAHFAWPGTARPAPQVCGRLLAVLRWRAHPCFKSALAQSS